MIDRLTTMTVTNAPITTKANVYLETFGCQMNVLDSQLVTSRLRELGYELIDHWQQADVVLYNTCSVREHAEQKVWSRVGEVGQHKQRTNPHVVLGVIGCMAERDGKDMVRKHPQVDLMCGPGELDKLPQLIADVRSQRQRESSDDLTPAQGVRHARFALQGNTHRRSATLAAAEDQLELLDLSRSFSPDDFPGAAYVRITRGCNKFCTYCVVPNTRGREIHRPPAHIVDEVRKLVDAGAMEVTLLGQTVNHYHFDTSSAVTIDGIVQPQIGAVVRNDGNGAQHLAGIDGKNGSAGRHGGEPDQVTRFADLLHMIHEAVPGLARLRFITSLPRDFGDDILQIMRDCPRICRYLHLPVQSGSDRMLKLMNRGYTVADYRDLVERVRSYLPDAEIATDIITGFPTETDEDHRQTLEMLAWAQCKNAFIFKYSPRPGTVAMDRFEDDVPDAVKRQRNNELLAVQAKASEQVHARYVGRRVRVLVESPSSKAIKAQRRAQGEAGAGTVELGWQRDKARHTQLTGRTEQDLIVCFDGPVSMIGQLVDVQINDSAALVLYGQVTAASKE